MRVLACGSRTFQDAPVVNAVLNGFLWEYQDPDDPFTIIEGGAKGADSLAGSWADNALNVARLTYPADWSGIGKAAGPIRNQQMLDEGNPAFCLAFIDKPLPESRGTADMVARCKARAIPTLVIARVA